MVYDTSILLNTGMSYTCQPFSWAKIVGGKHRSNKWAKSCTNRRANNSSNTNNFKLSEPKIVGKRKRAFSKELCHVYFRPHQSSFTRAQRIASIMCALFLLMICSAMFYRTESDAERPALIELGPLTLTMQELYVSCITASIVFPATLFVTLVFRNSKTKQKSRECKANGSEEDGDECDDIDVLMGELYQEIAGMQKEEREGSASRSKLLHEHFLLILAWTIAILAVIVSTFFVILYSMEWGAERSNAWLVSFLLSFVENVFIADPLKV